MFRYHPVLYIDILIQQLAEVTVWVLGANFSCVHYAGTLVWVQGLHWVWMQGQETGSLRTERPRVKWSSWGGCRVFSQPIRHLGSCSCLTWPIVTPLRCSFYCGDPAESPGVWKISPDNSYMLRS